MGTCARITKVAQYSSIRPPLLWAPLAVPAGPREGARTGARKGPLASLPQSRKSSSSRLLLPLPGHSFRPSTAIQISQPDFILVSRIFFIAPGPGALTVPFFRPLPRLHTRAPYVISAGNSVYAQSTRSRGLQARLHVRGLTYWTVYTLRVFMLRAVPQRRICTGRYKTPSRFPVQT